MYILLVCFTAINCPAAPHLTNSWTDTKSTTYGTKLTVTCQTGYTMAPFQVQWQQKVTCLASGNWSDVINDCIGIQFTETIREVLQFSFD